MAESAVTFLLDHLTPLVREELKLLGGIREDVEHIIDELERMRAFLRVADAMEDSDLELQVWVKQVREVAYDTEDVLDEFMLRLEHHHGDGFYGFLRKICFSIKNLKARYRIASEMQRIQSRVTKIYEGHQRYRYKFNISEQGSSSTSTSTAVNNTWYESRGDALLLEEAELVGIEKPKQQLIGWLIDGDSRLKLASVVGMGGLGKTTLVKRVYDDAGVKKHFHNHAWITVSQSFKIEELLKDTIQKLFDEIKQPVPQGVETMNSNRLKATINEFLQQRRYVLVFDDIWNIGAWEAVKYALPNSNCGSRVILTTRMVDVASASCVETDGYIYPLKPLSQEESWTLFCKKTFRGSSCPRHLMEISQSILNRCEGLPLAIVAIAGVLATKNTTRIDEWEIFHRSLGAELEGNDKLENMRTILFLSFNDLPYYLKSCFLYLSIFPEDHLIGRYTLIRLWIAEGFVKEKEGRTVEEVAEGFLNELVNRSLIQMVRTNSDGSIKAGRIHDFLREIIMLKSKDQNFVTIANHEQSTMWPRKVRRLSVHGILGNLQIKKRCGAQLRSLLSFSVSDSISKSSMLELLSSCRILKVLDLTGMPLETFPKDVFKLIHLRYLSFRNTKVKMLPSSIGMLQKLETLDLKNTYITELPVEILKLQRLRHLLVYRTEIYSYLPFDFTHGFVAPNGIGGLTSLQKLCFIEATNPGTSMLRELETMNQLRRLCILKLRKEDGMAVCSSIEKLCNLRSLNLASIDEDEILDVCHLCHPPQFLQRLILTGRLEKIPYWMQFLHSLVKVYFRWSRLRDDPLEYLQDLPNLVHLEFLVGFTGEKLCFKAGKFQKLKLLDLDKLEALRWVIVEEGAMPNLEKVIIQRCNLLQSVPTGIERLTNLKVLEFFDMPDEFIKTLRPDIHGEDYNKVAHIPEVYYTYWRDGGWEAYPLERARNNDQNHGPPTTAIRTHEQRNSL